MSDTPIDPIEEPIPLPSDEVLPDPASPLETDPAPFDAPRAVKAQFFQGAGGTLGANVRAPGDAETVGAGGRAPVSGEHNWVPIGPRNVGGRVRSLAIDPNGRTMYAGPASGGIYKTIDAGETWFPLWHDEPSLSMGAVAISPSNSAVVWAATGESSTGGGEVIPPSGVWRSTDAGVTWPANAAAQAAFGRVQVTALAPDPGNDAVCWAATSDGVFRTVNSGTSWEKYASGQAYSDVAILTVGANTWVFLAMSGFQTRPGPPVTQHAVLIRIQNPQIAHAALQAVLPDSPGAGLPTPPPPAANTFQLPVQPAGPSAGSTSAPADGKLAAFTRTGGVGPFLYAVWARQDRSLLRVFRLANLDAADGAGNPNLTVFRLAHHPDFGGESQGEYNLAIAVNPQNANHIAFGMQEMYINLNALANPSNTNHWLQAQNQFLYVVDRGHHADHHRFIFAPRPPAPFDQGVGAGAVWLWNANDGGISVSGDWQAATARYTSGQQSLPIPAGVATWRKRSHGISASQMYDLNQHPRLPSVLGCGFQDNGTYLSTGGMSWDLLFTADGGFVAFDPDDPYRVLATFQSGITEARFPGRIRDISPLLRDGAQTGTRPRDLTDGFRGSDRALFIPETVFHPTRPGRVMHARKNRLYGTRPTTGDRWHPLPLGCGVEIIHEPTANRATAGSIEVLDTPGAIAIGLLPQRSETQGGPGRALAEDRALGARARTLLAEPFNIQNGQQLRFVVHNNAAGQAPVPVNIALNVGANLPAQASAAQLAAHITNNSGGLLTALPVVWHQSFTITLFTSQTGRANTIQLSGTAMPRFPRNVPRVSTGANANGAFGASALPAVAFLEVGPIVDLSGLRLTVQRNGQPARNLDFGPGSLVTVQQLAARLRGALAADNVLVSTNQLIWGVRLTATTANGVANVTGSGAANFFNLLRAPARTFAIDGDFAVTDGSRGRRFDFTPSPPPPAPQLRIRDNNTGNQTANLNLTTAALGTADITHVTSVELIHSMRTQLAAAPANTPVRVDLDLNPRHFDSSWDPSDEGRVTEVAFAPSDPSIVWAGDNAGRMYLSRDGGNTWRQTAPLPILDLVGEVDAIAVHPEDPRTVFVGAYRQGSFDPARVPGMLWRTTNEGGDWHHVGADITDATGSFVGIRAVEIDPANTDHVFVGTDIGVWMSDNGGDSYETFNQGLPNARVTDLSFEPRQRLLRAGIWGRGVHERHVGTEAASDVRLHLRTTPLDDSWSQPVPGPDVAALTPTSARLDESPDIKHTLTDPRRGAVLDGVEFDEDVRHEDIRQGNGFVTVQINNRGAFPTSTARVALLWALADNGPPVLPSTLWDALAAGPLVAGNTFDQWTVIGDVLVPDPNGVNHNVISPGYPRCVVFGVAPVVAFPAAINTHRRVGLLALVRSDEDHLPRGPDNVFDVVHAQPKAAYRESDVVLAADDDRIVLRATTPTGFTVVVPGGAFVNGANGAAPFGLAAVGAATSLVELATAGPYNLGAGAAPATTLAFRLQTSHSVTVTFAPNDPAIRTLGRAFADEVAAVINASLIDAGIPVRADGRSFNPPVPNAVFIEPLGGARVRITAGGATNAAGALGLPTGVTRTAANNEFFVTAAANAGPFNLTPVGANPRTLRFTVIVDALIQFPATTREIPALATASARQVRAAVNRQFREAGIGVVAERRRTGLSVRRSPTETTDARIVTGGFGLGDLVVNPGAELAAGPARDALFDVVTTFGPDPLVRAATNRLYLRSANTGNVNIAQVRHRLFHIVLDPFAVTNVGNTVNEARNAGQSGVAALTWDVPALDVGSRVFVLAIADTAATPLDTAPITSLELAHQFCVTNPNAALREFVVA